MCHVNNIFPRKSASFLKNVEVVPTKGSQLFITMRYFNHVWHNLLPMKTNLKLQKFTGVAPAVREISQQTQLPTRSKHT